MGSRMAVSLPVCHEGTMASQASPGGHQPPTRCRPPPPKCLLTGGSLQIPRVSSAREGKNPRYGHSREDESASLPAPPQTAHFPVLSPQKGDSGPWAGKHASARLRGGSSVSPAGEAGTISGAEACGGGSRTPSLHRPALQTGRELNQGLFQSQLPPTPAFL